MAQELRMPAAFKALQRSQACDDGVVEAGNLDDKALSDSTYSGPARISVNSGNISNTSNCEATGDYDDFCFDNEASSTNPSATSSLFEPASTRTDQTSTSTSTKLTNQDTPSRKSSRSALPRITATSDSWPKGGRPASLSAVSDNSANSPRPNMSHSAPSFQVRNQRLANAQSVPVQLPSLHHLPSNSSFNVGLDRYGFKKPIGQVPEEAFDAWSIDYAKYMERRKEKWTALLQAHGLSPDSQGGAPVRFPPESQRLRRYVRKGIPPEWRGNAWFWYAHGYDKLNAHPGLYDNLVDETKALKNSDTEHIERDLHRTFPDNIYFRNDPLTNEESKHLKALRRVLTAFSVYQPKIGYCQSLNFIAGNLLLFIDEERAFWMLVIITQNYLSGLHEVNLEQVNISQGILMISVRDRLPKIWNALNLEQSFEDNFISNLPPISLCTAPWFMSLMVNVLPTETMMRVWDCFFLEGPKTLYRISLTVFKLVEAQMTHSADELEVFQIVQAAPRTLYDPEVLMKSCFRRVNGFGHISNEDIAVLRAFVQSRRTQALDGAEQRTSDRHAYAKLYRGRRIRAKLSLYR